MSSAEESFLDQALNPRMNFEDFNESTLVVYYTLQKNCSLEKIRNLSGCELADIWMSFGFWKEDLETLELTDWHGLSVYLSCA